MKAWALERGSERDRGCPPLVAGHLPRRRSPTYKLLMRGTIRAKPSCFSLSSQSSELLAFGMPCVDRLAPPQSAQHVNEGKKLSEAAFARNGQTSRVKSLLQSLMRKEPMSSTACSTGLQPSRTFRFPPKTRRERCFRHIAKSDNPVRDRCYFRPRGIRYGSMNCTNWFEKRRISRLSCTATTCSP